MKTFTTQKRAYWPFPLSRSVMLLASIGLHAGPMLHLQAAETKNIITDSGITTAVESDLRFAKGVFPDSIDVNTSQGIVTLSGSADNLLARERAVKIAQSIRGVRGVIDRIAVTPVSRPDEDIRKDILMALLQDPATESYQVAVAVKDAVATLTGSVGSWAESQLAARIAKGVKGLKEIHNGLTINYLNTRTDAELAADVKANLQWDIWLNGEPIKAEVKDGRVTLDGTVGSALGKLRAVDDAWVTGVKAVDDTGVKVEPQLENKMRRKGQYVIKADNEIKQAVEAALRRDPRVSPFSPDVRVVGGVVILSGAVGNLKAKIAAEQDAKNTVGVGWVDNLLKVRPNLTPSDPEIEASLKAALRWDPVLEGSQIEVAVINRVAYLSGGVDDYFQRSEAGDVASRTKGVLLVRNHLKVEPAFGLYYYDWPFYSYYNWPYPYSYPETFGPVPPKSDEEIKKAIEKAFFWSPFVDRDDINVKVHGGVATLTGQVGSWIGYEKAYQDARKSGAADVINKLTVKKGAWF
jgi:osmotically-inducible protein OsmY